MVLGLGQLNLPFKAGVMLPTLDLVKMLPTNASGELSLNTAWPAGSPAFTMYMQYWISDAAGPSGFKATQGWSVRQD